jgi:8-oxo-(d)GTP phosphatase
VPSVQVEAAGGVLWRGDPARPEVALVHRPRYDDWSVPKGKLETGEHPLLAGLREIEEETGFMSLPGRRLGSVRYAVAEGRKRVRYWACEAAAGKFRASREVDELWWGTVADALARVDSDGDARVLETFAADTRRTRALVLVRHASAGDRHRFDGKDAERPLDAEGKERARTVAALLTAYDVRRAGTADVTRCRETLAPFATSGDIEVATLPATTAGAFDSDPDAGSDEVLALLDGAGGAAWCGQREVIPDLAVALAERLGGLDTGGGRGVRDLADLRKGALLLLHVDEQRRLASVERLPG